MIVMRNDENVSVTKTSKGVTTHSLSSVTDNEEVLFQTIDIQQGLRIGLITLNREKSLNALTTSMCQLISVQLTIWETDDSLVAIVLRGAGERALCAGGDIRNLYAARQQWDGEGIAPPEAVDFFTNEYHLDTQMHEYHKPIITWGNGIVMGGGMGVLSSSSHRIVTETTRAAMPEVNIGLFPDATGSWFLQRFPAKSGLFMGLTGADANANDALLCNLADFRMNSQDFDKMVQCLAEADWSNVVTLKNKQFQSLKLNNVVTKALSQCSMESIKNTDFAPSNIAKHLSSIQNLMTCGGLDKIDSILMSDEQLQQFCADLANDPWFKSALGNYRYGCPVTKAITYEMYQRAHNLSLSEVMALETNVALHCIVYPDFSEGVRALLIDKDRNPKWSRTMEECLNLEGQAYIQGHFEELH